MANNDLNQIRIFSEVAKLQSFTKAAESLDIEKSTVSTKVGQLESRLGIRLLQRTTRSVSLTEAGAQYLSFCEQALEALQQGDDYIADLNHIPSGKLRISAPENLIEFILPNIIAPFLRSYPDVDLEVIQTSRTVDVIKEKFDIAIVSSTNDIKDSSLIYRKIINSYWALIASSSIIEQYGVPNSIDDLMKIPSIGTIIDNNEESPNSRYFHWQNKKITLKHRFAINNLRAVIAAVKEGLGMALIPPSMVANELRNKELAILLPDAEIPNTSLYLVYPSRSGQPAKQKAFADVMVNWGESMDKEIKKTSQELSK